MADHTNHRPQPLRSRRASGVIARQLALGFALVSLVAMSMCGMLIYQLMRVGEHVDSMTHHEHAIRNGAELVISVREQYIHLAHTLIEADLSHLDHYFEWGEKVRELARRLEMHLPVDQRARLQEIHALSLRIDELFRQRLVPSLAPLDVDRLREEHRKLERLAKSAFAQADRIAQIAEGTMATEHVSATDVTRSGLVIGLLCVGLVLMLSIGYTVRLRRSVLTPLERLVDAARAFGAGQLHTRLGPIGEGELQDVATAFDAMATELVEREGRLLRAERMAAIGQLAAGVAHEVNNPIGIIRGYLKTMQTEDDPAVLREELRILDEEAAACQRIAEDLLAYARQPQLELSRLDVAGSLDEATRRIRDTRGLTFDRVAVTAEDGAPVLADPARLRQVLVNLILNAVESSPESEPVRIVGRALPGGDYQIEVIDRGPGIAPEDQARVFEPFFTGRSGGTGLGLAVCQGVVTAHGGTIEIDSDLDHGTTFRVLLRADGPNERSS